MEDRDDLENLASWRNLHPDDLCPECGGSGKEIASATPWPGGVDGLGPCGECWGSGSKSRPWLNLRRLADALRERPDVAENLRGATPFIAYPDWSKTGRARFLMAVAVFDVRILRRGGKVGPPDDFAVHFLVECKQRKAFAAAAGTERRPISTEDAPKARVRGESATEHLERLVIMCLLDQGPSDLGELRRFAGPDGRRRVFHQVVVDMEKRGAIVREEAGGGMSVGSMRYDLPK
jgi:hypothetical protein